MDRSAKTRGPSRVFVSYPDPDAARVRTAFANEIMRLLTMSPDDYVATADVDATMAALTAGAAGAEPDDDRDVDIAEARAAIGAGEAPRPHLSFLLRHGMRRGGDADDARLLPEILQGTHLAEALMAGRELIGPAKRRPADRAIVVISGKAGSGKTTLLAHLSSMALSQRDRKLAVIDLAYAKADHNRDACIVGEVSSADLVVIDNADDQLSTPDRNALWSMLRQRLPNSTSILIAAGADMPTDANAPWRMLSGRRRDVSIGSFNCAFRRDLIGDLSRRRQKATGGAAMPKAAIDRMAEELWGDGWQLGAAVDAYGAYRHVMARQPTAKEIDEIAANIGSRDMRAPPSIETITDVVARFDDRDMRATLAGEHDDSAEASHGVVLYLAKTLTKHPHDQLARQLGLGRRSAVQAMHRIERAQRASNAIGEALQSMKAELACRATQAHLSALRAPSRLSTVVSEKQGTENHQRDDNARNF